MKKITAEKVRADAQKTHLSLFFICLLLTCLPFFTIRALPYYGWLVAGVVLLLSVDGYYSLRLLLDKRSLKHYLIKRNDERNVQLENLALHQVVKVMGNAYIFLVIFTSRWLSERLPQAQVDQVDIVLIGFGLIGLAVYQLVKWHYARKL